MGICYEIYYITVRFMKVSWDLSSEIYMSHNNIKREVLKNQTLKRKEETHHFEKLILQFFSLIILFLRRTTLLRNKEDRHYPTSSIFHSCIPCKVLCDFYPFLICPPYMRGGCKTTLVHDIRAPF